MAYNRFIPEQKFHLSTKSPQTCEKKPNTFSQNAINFCFRKILIAHCSY